MFHQGLSSAEVQERVQKGLKNIDTTPATKTVRQIVLSHCLTLFNAVNLALAILVIAVGSYRNLLFMGVVISNTLIGIFQEIRAKRIVDLTFPYYPASCASNKRWKGTDRRNSGTGSG